MINPYNSKFYEHQESNSIDSARIIVPIIVKLIRPRSVIDIGCGLGTWLKVFEENGVDDILGIDGVWVNKDKLYVSKDKFISADLKKPINIKKRFDLAISLEVGEHLPKESADILVESLTNLSDTILFSAAIPYQGGVDHINEQWQDYWVNKFEKGGYRAIDCIRKRVWRNKKVSFFYAQNTILFVKPNKIKKNKELKREFESTNRDQMSIIHPERYQLLGRQRSNVSRFLPLFVRKILSKILS